uniref:UPAR/Ly6 domain-containing protein n=1 Tax=Panagrellus redivivus TaxID=6233 RepID=A0A7E4VU94_PANRE
MPSKGIGVVLLLLLSGYAMVALAVRCHSSETAFINEDVDGHFKECDVCYVRTNTVLDAVHTIHGCKFAFGMTDGYTLDEIEDVRLSDGTVSIGSKIRHCATDYCNFKIDPPPSLTCYHNFDRYSGILYPTKGKKNTKKVSGCRACLYQHNFVSEFGFGEFIPDIYECLDQSITLNKPELYKYPRYGMVLVSPNTCNEGSYEGVNIKYMYCDSGDLCTDACGNANHIGMGWGAVLAVLVYFAAYLNW